MNKNVNKTSKSKRTPQQGVSTTPKHNRKPCHKRSESSSLSSNRNSSGQSDGEARISIYTRQQQNHNSSEGQEHAVKKLQSQVRELRHKLRVLEECADNKDVSLSAITREKDRAVGEVRRLERNNRQLRQQLKEERNHYLEEKEKFCAEMTRCKRKLQEMKKENVPTLPASGLKPTWQKESPDRGGGDDFNLSKTQFRKSNSVESLHLYGGDNTSLQMAALRTENAKLRSIISERDERNYELCLRFLRMKHCKNDLKTRFQDLENEYLQVITNLMEKIDEARQEFNFIIDQKFKKPLHQTNAAYLQLVQRNSRMAFENASLRLEIQGLRKELSKYGVLDFGRRGNLSILEEEGPCSQDEAKNKKSNKKNVNFKELRTIFENDFNFKTSDTDSNYMSKTSTTDVGSGSLGEPKSNESIVVGDLPTNRVPSDVVQRIFQKEESSSTSSIMNLPLDTRTRRRLCGKNPKDMQTNTQDYHSEKDADKKTYNEMSVRKTQPKQGKEQNPVVKLLPQSQSRAQDKKNSVYTQVCKANEENQELIKFSPRQTSQFKEKRDLCGLQEKVNESSDLGTAYEKFPNKANVQEWEADEDEDVRRTKTLQTFQDDYNLSSRNRNVVSLHDELMEVTKTQMTTADDPFWRREMKLHSLLNKEPSKNKTKHTKEPKSQAQNTEIGQDAKGNTQESKAVATETKKRFSKKLVATSPEKLKSLLQDQTCYQLAPLAVKHQVMDPRMALANPEHANEILLRLFQAVSARNSSRTQSSNGPETKRSNLPPKQSDNMILPLSNLPTSTSTMGVTDSSVTYNTNDAVMRTLSAPGLLESEWLDSYRICEMKDSSTNT